MRLNSEFFVWRKRTPLEQSNLRLQGQMLGMQIVAVMVGALVVVSVLTLTVITICWGISL